MLHSLESALQPFYHVECYISVQLKYLHGVSSDHEKLTNNYGKRTTDVTPSCMPPINSHSTCYNMMNLINGLVIILPITTYWLEVAAPDIGEIGQSIYTNLINASIIPRLFNACTVSSGDKLITLVNSLHTADTRHGVATLGYVESLGWGVLYWVISEMKK